MGNTWKIVLATVVIFGAGVGTGGLLVDHADRAKIQRVVRQQAARANWQLGPREVVQRGDRELRPMMEQKRMDFILRAHRELELTPEQQERVEKIVREGQEKTKAFWEKAAPELHKDLQEVRERIHAELTPEQRKKFEQILRQQQARAAEPKSGQPAGSTSAPGRSSSDNRRPGLQREGGRPDRSAQPPLSDNPPTRAREGLRGDRPPALPPQGAGTPTPGTPADKAENPPPPAR
jgi:hypothetical protein